jgi:uncharacterized protein (DUF3084 family)
MAGSAGTAWGQTATKKPQPAPASTSAESATSLSGGRATGKLLTLEELRACMTQRDSLGERRIQLDKERTQLNAEREAVEAEGKTLKAAEQELLDHAGKIKDLNARMEQQKAKGLELQARAEEIESSGKSGPIADRQRRVLAADQQALQKGDAALMAEAKALNQSIDAAKLSYNQRVSSYEATAADWNRRNREIAQKAKAYEDDRMDWADACGNRRFKEDDEKRLKAGK